MSMRAASSSEFHSDEQQEVKSSSDGKSTFTGSSSMFGSKATTKPIEPLKRQKSTTTMDSAHAHVAMEHTSLLFASGQGHHRGWLAKALKKDAPAFGQQRSLSG